MARLSFLQNIPNDLRTCTGGRRLWLAFAFGTLASLSFAPTGLVPVLWITFPALIFLLQGTHSFRSAFATGWSFALGLFVFSLYWIAASLLVDLEHYWWGLPFALLGLPAFLAVYYGLAAGLARKMGVEGVTGALTLALFWFLADFARGHLLTGFPWNLTGASWVHVLPVLQSVSVFGIYGLSLITLILVCLPATLNKKLIAGSLVFLALLALGGEARLLQANQETVPHLRFRLVMPNTDQAHKWIADEREHHFQMLLDASAAPADIPLTHIVWPETASTFFLTEDTAHRRDAAAVVPENGALLTGVIRRDADDHYFNSLIALDRSGRVIRTYDKAHLVPFGEYIPFRRWLPLRALSALGIDFGHGAGVKTLHIDNLPSFSPLICYEAIFSGDVAQREDRPNFLVNITNDGWFGPTAGPYQHFAIARTRAIEEGLPLIRAANQGLSGVVNAYGQIVVVRDRTYQGFVDSNLPTALPPTLFARYGTEILWSLFGLGVLVIGIGKGKRG